MPTYLALYQGTSIKSAKMVAVTVDATLVAMVAAQMLNELELSKKDDDSIINELMDGRKRALRLIHRDTNDHNAGA